VRAKKLHIYCLKFWNC